MKYDDAGAVFVYYGEGGQGRGGQAPIRLNMLKRLIDFIAINVVIVILTLVADRTPLLRQLDSALREIPEPYLPATVLLTVVGFGLFVGVLIYSLARNGRPAARPLRRAQTVSEIKRALLSGSWRRDPTWVHFLLATAGGLMFFFGLFGLFFVIGPPVAKLMAGMTILYALARLVWAFARA